MKPKILIVFFFILTMLFQISPAHAEHFTPIWTGNPSMSLMITSIGNYSVEIGDEVGVFDNNKCVGSGVVAGVISEQTPLIITASQDDGGGNGFTEGNAISFKFWDTSQQAEMIGINAVVTDTDGNPVAPTFKGNEDYSVALTIPSQDVMIKVSRGAGKPGTSVTLSVTAEGNVDLDMIMGTAFTLEYSNDLLLESVESQFFDTFQAQIQAAKTNPPPTPPEPGAVYQNSNALAEVTKTMISAARGIATSNAAAAGNELFELTFKLKPDVSVAQETYDIKVLPTTLKATSAGYNPGGETVDILVGYDNNQPAPGPQAFPVLIDRARDADGYSLHAEHGAISFGDYKITAGVNDPNWGTITPSGEVGVMAGADKEFTITPKNACYQIEDVLVDGTSIASQTSYVFVGVDTDHTIEAKFSVSTYVVNVSPAAGGKILSSDTPVTGDVPADCGTSKTFTFTPDPCFRITEVFVDGNSVLDKLVDSTYTFPSIEANHSIEATFAAVDKLIITGSVSGGGGTLSPSGEVEVTCAENQTFTITPESAECHSITDVLVDGKSVKDKLVGNAYTFENVINDHKIEAVFESKSYNIEIVANEGGTISPSAPDGSTTVAVACKSSPEFTITPDECHKIESIWVDDVLVGTVNAYTFSNVALDHKLEAVFAPKSFNIIASAGNGGSITPSGAVPAECKTDTTFTITPANGYHIVDVTVDGKSEKVTGNSYTFPQVIDDHTILANFAQNLPGDVNGDKKVDMKDAILALKILANVSTEEGICSQCNIQLSADVNDDGLIGFEEVIYVLRYILEVQ